MDARLVEFTQRHSESTDPRVVEIVRAIRDGSVELRDLSEGVSSSSLARTYAIRSGIGEGQGRHADAASMLTLSEQCEANGDNPCSIWMIEGTDMSFCVFELAPSKAVAGSFRFEGAFGDVQNDA